MKIFVILNLLYVITIHFIFPWDKKYPNTNISNYLIFFSFYDKHITYNLDFYKLIGRGQI